MVQSFKHNILRTKRTFTWDRFTAWRPLRWLMIPGRSKTSASTQRQISLIENRVCSRFYLTLALIQLKFEI